MNFLWSIAGIIFVTTISSLLGSFFDVDEKFYVPFMVWFIALFLFNMFLEKQHINIFMKEILGV
jgi:hypothetical protein